MDVTATVVCADLSLLSQGCPRDNYSLAVFDPPYGLGLADWDAEQVYIFPTSTSNLHPFFQTSGAELQQWVEQFLKVTTAKLGVVVVYSSYR